jgi:hypothetical protein
MEQLIIAIALWCGQPVGGGSSTYISLNKINQCRATLLLCIEDRKENRYYNDRIIKCFKDSKVGN